MIGYSSLATNEVRKDVSIFANHFFRIQLLDNVVNKYCLVAFSVIMMLSCMLYIYNLYFSFVFLMRCLCSWFM
jgi:hypothetical protein